jgi:hypothetical protein
VSSVAHDLGSRKHTAAADPEAVDIVAEGGVRSGVYEAGHTKRKRSTKTELAARYEALSEIVAAAAPTGVRFCYYRAVSQGIVPKTNNGYVLVQRALMHLRETGAIPWASITDSSRWMRKPETWNSVEDLLADAASSYRRALWSDANALVEVWCESESVAGVIWPVTSEWDVPLYPIKGQTSASFAYSAAMTYRHDDRPVIIYYVGDHDPAGLEIEANLAHKLREYSEHDGITFQRLACTPEQVAELALIGYPPKKDTWRHPTLGAQPFIGEAVEVEAIDAPILRDLVKAAITSHLDPHELDVIRTVEQSEREGLTRMAHGWW